MELFEELNMGKKVTYAIPVSKDYPSQLHGYKLGNKFLNVRHSKTYVKNNPSRAERLRKEVSSV